ncbi:hypothetical protein [Dyella sp.]|uniref:hypothetical protein n=1 Tax=Dyella sp. TaxID=1869338 RepID=UPI003F7EFBAF
MPPLVWTGQSGMREVTNDGGDDSIKAALVELLPLTQPRSNYRFMVEQLPAGLFHERP